ncbi:MULTISPECIES: hypothetical protein [unclassified Bifidobacterium]|uniref:helix-hairpin-helix domain-containing protein n=1 Tax=unclassified Bifidobacterium TaxID=2608897 RepID=UPI00112DE7CC
MKDTNGRVPIRMGLSIVPMVSLSMAERIMDIRRRDGRFAGFPDFLHRLPSDFLNTRGDLDADRGRCLRFLGWS